MTIRGFVVTRLVLFSAVLCAVASAPAYAETLLILDDSGQLHEVDTATGITTPTGAPKANLDALTSMRDDAAGGYRVFAYDENTGELIEIHNYDAADFETVVGLDLEVTDLTGSPCEFLLGIRPRLPDLSELFGFFPNIEDCISQQGLQSIPQAIASSDSIALSPATGQLYAYGLDEFSTPEINIYTVNPSPTSTMNVFLLPDVRHPEEPLVDLFFGAESRLYAITPANSLIELNPATGSTIGVIVPDLGFTGKDGAAIPPVMPSDPTGICEMLEGMFPQIHSFTASIPMFLREDVEPPPDLTVENTFTVDAIGSTHSPPPACPFRVTKVYMCYDGEIYEAYRSSAPSETSCDESWERSIDVQPYVEQRVWAFVANNLGLVKWQKFDMAIVLQNQGLDATPEISTMAWASDMVASLLSGTTFLAMVAKFLEPKFFQVEIDVVKKKITGRVGVKSGSASQFEDANQGNPATSDDPEQSKGFGIRAAFGYTIPLENPTSPTVSGKASAAAWLGKDKKYFGSLGASLKFDFPDPGENPVDYFANQSFLEDEGPALNIDFYGAGLIYRYPLDIESIPVLKKLDKWVELNPVSVYFGIGGNASWFANSNLTKPGELANLTITPRIDAGSVIKLDVKALTIKTTVVGSIFFPVTFQNVDPDPPDRVFFFCLGGSLKASARVKLGWFDVLNIAPISIFNLTTDPFILIGREYSGGGLSCGSSASGVQIDQLTLPPDGSILGTAVATGDSGEILEVVSVDLNFDETAVGGGDLPPGSSLEAGRILVRSCVASSASCGALTWHQIPLPSEVDGQYDHHYAPSATYTTAGVPVVVWTHADNEGGLSVGDIYYSYRPLGGSWITGSSLHTSGFHNFAHSPSIEADISGGAAVVWTVDGERAGGEPMRDTTAARNATVQLRRLVSSGSTLAPAAAAVTINDGSFPINEYPDVAVDKIDRALVVWTAYQGNHMDEAQDVLMRYVLPGGGLAQVQTVSETGPDDMPSVTFDPANKAILTWVKTGGYGACCADADRSSDWLAYSSKEDNGTTYDLHLRDLEDDRHLQLTDDGFNQMDPAIASDGTCTLVVYSTKEDGDDFFDIWARPLAKNTGLPLGVAIQLTYEDVDQIEPDLIYGASGDGKLVYVQLDTGGGRLLVERELTGSCVTPGVAPGSTLADSPGIDHPAFGEDATQIYFSGYPGPYLVRGGSTVTPGTEIERSQSSNIYLFDTSGPSISPVTESRADQSFPYYHNGYLVYASTEDGEERGDAIFSDPDLLGFEAEVVGGTAVDGHYQFGWTVTGQASETGPQPVIQFETPGQKTLSVVVTDGQGATNSNTSTNQTVVTIRPDGPPLAIAARANPTRFRVPLVGVSNGDPTFGTRDVVIEAGVFGGAPPYGPVQFSVPGFSLDPVAVDEGKAVSESFSIGSSLDHSVLEGTVQVVDAEGNLARAHFPIIIGDPGSTFLVHPTVSPARDTSVPVDIYLMRADGTDIVPGRTAIKVGESSDDARQPVIKVDAPGLAATEAEVLFTEPYEYVESCGVLPISVRGEFDAIKSGRVGFIQGVPHLGPDDGVAIVLDLLVDPTEEPPVQLGRSSDMSMYGVSQRVVAQVYDPGAGAPDQGDFLPEELPISNARVLARHPKVVGSASGNAMVVWRERVHGSDKISYVTVTTSDYQWACPDPLADENDTLWRHDVSMTPFGRAVITRVWENFADPTFVEDLRTTDIDLVGLQNGHAFVGASASGGLVAVTINGHRIEIPTSAGQSATEVALALALEINAHEALSGMGIVAVASGNSVVVYGTNDVVFDVDDFGLNQPVSIPALSAPGILIVALCLLVLLAVLARKRVY